MDINDSLANVIVHVDETLDEDSLHFLEDEIRHNPGVVAVGHNPQRPHMLMVAYDADMAHPSTFLQHVQGHGYHAQLVGL